MRMSELSRRSDVPVPTIKYYLREGLLPRGRAVGPNQADYAETHLKRLRLIRALIEVGGIGIAGAKGVIDAIDSDLPIEQTFGIAQRTVSEEIDPASVDQGALERVDGAAHGWQVSPANPGRLAAARALTAFSSAGQPVAPAWVDRYAEAAMLVAEADLDEIAARNGRQDKAELIVIGTVLGDAVFSGLRRAAQEHVSVRRYREVAGAAAPTHDSTQVTASDEEDRS